jgi:hypothetical protein
MLAYSGSGGGVQPESLLANLWLNRLRIFFPDRPGAMGLCVET